MANLAGPTLVLGVSQQDPDIVVRPHENRRLRTLDYIDTASVTVAGRFSDYWSARGRNLRQNLRRQRNRLKRDGTIPRLEIITQSHAIDDAVDEYGFLETSGWKSRQGTALHPENSQGRFYKALFKHFCAREEAMVFRYLYAGKLVAADLCLHRGGVILILKTAYNEELKKSSPAMLMREEAFEYIFDSGCFQRIEFYGKVMDWHTKWSNEIRTLYHVNYFRSSLVANLFDISRRHFTRNS
jgi:CelD/BcsL family acetyltransferase involved in cellulose biosynthesis